MRIHLKRRENKFEAMGGKDGVPGCIKEEEVLARREKSGFFKAARSLSGHLCRSELRGTQEQMCASNCYLVVFL